MRRLVFLLVLLSLQCKEVEPSLLSSETQSRIRKELLADGFEGLVFVAIKGKVVFRETISSSKEYRTKQLYKKHSFPLGENSQIFTSFLIRQLLDKGKLKLTDKVCKFLPEFPYPEVQIIHLLRHTSGLPKFQELEKKNNGIVVATEQKDPFKALIQMKKPLSFSPGQYWKFTRLDYAVLAQIVESIEKEPFFKILEKNVFIPLKMKQTQGLESDVFKGNSGISSTPEDLLLFQMELLNPRILEKSTTAELFQYTFVKDSYSEDRIMFGEGIFLGDYFHWQFGKVKNLASLVYLDRKSKVSIILVNPWHGTVGELNSNKSHITEIIFNARKLVFKDRKSKENEVSILDLLKENKVPGVGIAVYKNFKLEWKKNFGISNAETGKLLTPNTLFRAGSLTKPVTAFTIVKLSELGKVDLFANIESKLRKYRIKNEEPEQFGFINLDSILSHTSGLTEKGDWDLPENLEKESITEIKDKLKDEEGNGLSIYYQAGSKSRYSGGGYSVLQEVITEAARKPFSSVAKDLVFKPLGWSQSTFDQSSDSALDLVSGHDPSGKVIEAKHFIPAEIGSGGLWTTPEEIGNLFVEVAKAANGNSQILKTKSALYMLTPKMSAANLTVHASVGRGFFINETSKSSYFFHGGHTKGHKGLAFFNATKGYGVVILTNSENGSPIIWSILRAIAIQENWDKFVN